MWKHFFEKQKAIHTVSLNKLHLGLKKSYRLVLWKSYYINFRKFLKKLLLKKDSNADVSSEIRKIFLNRHDVEYWRMVTGDLFG